AEFWKRWHISLSTWLKDYLYIPMGGNRSGSLFSNIMIGVILLFLSLLAADFWIIAFFISLIGASYVVSKVSITFRDWLSTNVNLMLTMLIGGLWHGASWNFVVWGGLNGLGLVVYKLWRKVSPWEDSAAWYVRPLRVVITLVFITFTRIWFRSESWESASIMLRRIVYHFEPQVVLDVLTGSQAVMLIMLAGYTIHWLPTTFKNWYQEKIANAHILLKGVIALVTILLVYQVLSADLQPFIYFAF
ncbi:MAG: MBOAT family O-acyltransferase, partial [Bacteroidota bacterium]